MDSNNNLHVMFESDRSGINQVYYGNLGVDNNLSAISTFSSSIDKYSEFLSEGDLPFDYFSPLLLKAHTPDIALNPSNNPESPLYGPICLT